MKYWIIKNDPGFRMQDWLRDFHWISDDSLVDDWAVEVKDDLVQPGDVIFIWSTENPDLTGIIAQGKIVARHETLPLEEQKASYYREKRESRPASKSNIAVKYNRFYMGNPPGTAEMESEGCGLPVTGYIDHPGQILEIPGEIGKKIQWILAGRTTFIDLTYCQT